MNSTFWIGVYPGLSEEMLDYMTTEIRGYVNHPMKKQGEIK